MSDESFDLVVAKMESMKAQLLTDLNRDLFAAGADRPSRPLTWRERLSLRRSRVRAYFATLWLAIKGDDPYDSW